MLIKILSNFLLPIALNKMRKGNRGAFGEKTSYKAAFLIFLLQNSSKNAFLLFSLHLLIVTSNLCFLVAKSGVGIFGKDNIGKGKSDDGKEAYVQRQTEE